MPQANSNETPPETMAEAYAEMDLLLTKAFDEPINQDPTTHKWLRVGQAATSAGRLFKFWDNVSNSELAGSILDHDNDTNIASILLEGQEEPSEIHTSLLRGAGSYIIKHKKGRVIATATVSIAIGSLYIWAKKHDHSA